MLTVKLPLSQIDQFLKYQYLLDNIDPKYIFHIEMKFITEKEKYYLIDFEMNDLVIHSIDDYNKYYTKPSDEFKEKFADFIYILQN